MIIDDSYLPIHLFTYLRIKIRDVIGVLNVLKYNHTRYTLNRLRKAKYE